MWKKFSLKGFGASWKQNLFPNTIIDKIFEIKCCFHVKKGTTKVAFAFFKIFLLVLTKFSFLEEDWALGSNSIRVWDSLVS